MLMLKTRIQIFITLIFFMGLTISVHSQNKTKVAVLHFDNNADSRYDNFVRGLPSMLITTLARSHKIILVERLQIEKALQTLALEQSGLIKEETAVRVGQWIGADIIVLGNFTEFGGNYRIDARLIDVNTGKLLVAKNVKGDQTKIIENIDELGIEIIKSFIGEEIQLNKQGILEIKFRLTHAPLIERPIYYHICKLFIDNVFTGISPAARVENEWRTLFSMPVPAGKHEIKIQHGYVDEKEDVWIGEFEKQPKIFKVEISPGTTSLLKYEFHTGRFSDEFKYFY